MLSKTFKNLSVLFSILTASTAAKSQGPLPDPTALVGAWTMPVFTADEQFTNHLSLTLTSSGNLQGTLAVPGAVVANIHTVTLNYSGFKFDVWIEKGWGAYHVFYSAYWNREKSAFVGFARQAVWSGQPGNGGETSRETTFLGAFTGARTEAE